MNPMSFDEKEKEHWGADTSPHNHVDSEIEDFDNERDEQHNDLPAETWEELAHPNAPLSAAGQAADPPPDGGWAAWIQVACAHLVLMNCWGLIQSFGVIQLALKDRLNESLSNISWVGSVQIFLLFSVGMFSGRALDAGYFKQTFFTGLAFQMLGMFTLSVGQKYWQVLLSGGIAQGIGAGLTFCPTMALLSTYFSTRRSLAIGIAAAGSGIGGLVYPSIIRSLLPKVGFGWSIRVCGFVMGTVGLLAGCFLRTRVPPRKAGPLIELAAFKELPYTLYCIGAFLFFMGTFFPFYYSSSFARDIIGMSYSESATILIVMNAIGIITRILPNYLADRYTGPTIMLIPCLFGSAIITYAWAGVHNRAGVWIWSVFYGLFAAGVQGVFPAALSTLTTDLTKQGARMGMAFFIAGLGALIGSPLGGVLIQARGDYLYAQVALGSAILAGGLMVSGSKIASVRAKNDGKVSLKALLRK